MSENEVPFEAAATTESTNAAEEVVEEHVEEEDQLAALRKQLENLPANTSKAIRSALEAAVALAEEERERAEAYKATSRRAQVLDLPIPPVGVPMIHSIRVSEATERIYANMRMSTCHDTVFDQQVELRFSDGRGFSRLLPRPLETYGNTRGTVWSFQHEAGEPFEGVMKDRQHGLSFEDAAVLKALEAYKESGYDPGFYFLMDEEVEPTVEAPEAEAEATPVNELLEEIQQKQSEGRSRGRGRRGRRGRGDRDDRDDDDDDRPSANRRRADRRRRAMEG